MAINHDASIFGDANMAMTGAAHPAISTVVNTAGGRALPQRMRRKRGSVCASMLDGNTIELHRNVSTMSSVLVALWTHVDML